MMNCNLAMERYCSLDKNQRVPLGVTAHLFLCPGCRTAVRRMTIAERFCSMPYQPVSGGASDPSVQAVLDRIVASGLTHVNLDQYERPVSMLRWIVSGLALVLGFAFIPFTFMGEWSGHNFGSSFSLPFFIVCGVAVTAWCGVFVGTNIDFFVKKFGLQHG